MPDTHPVVVLQQVYQGLACLSGCLDLAPLHGTAGVGQPVASDVVARDELQGVGPGAVVDPDQVAEWLAFLHIP